MAPACSFSIGHPRRRKTPDYTTQAVQITGSCPVRILVHRIESSIRGASPARLWPMARSVPKSMGCEYLFAQEVDKMFDRLALGYQGVLDAAHVGLA